MTARRVISLILAQVAVIVGILAAVTVAARSISKTARFTSDGKTIISFWNIYPDNDPGRPFMDELISEFEAQNPDIVVQQYGVNFWDYFTKLNVVQGGNGKDAPDVFMQNIANIPQRAGTISMDLSGFLKPDDVITPSNYPADETKYTFCDGGLYGLPFSADARYLYYNKTMLKDAGYVDENGNAKPPATLDELYDMAVNLTKTNATNDGYDVVGFSPKMGNNNLTDFVWPQGGSFFDANGLPTTLTDPTIGRAFDWWRKFVSIYKVGWYNSLINTCEDTTGDSTDASVFYTGHAALVISNMSLEYNTDLNNPSLDYGIAPIPYVEGHQTSFAGGFSIEVANKILQEYKGLDTAEKAWRLASFFASTGVQERLFKEMGIMPTLLPVVDDLVKNDTSLNDNQKALLELSKYRQQFDYIPAWSSWYGSYNTHLSDYEVGRGGLTLEQTLQQIYDELMQGIDRYNSYH